MEINKSKELFCQAKGLMPGGVNSPVRAFNSVGGTPRFIHHAKGAYLYDEDNNEYIDYIGSWGPMILGHNPDFVIESVSNQLQCGLSYGATTELEVKMAKLISEIVPCVEMIRMVNSGTEAVMSAIRVARGFTHRDKIIKFEGCYHGHADAMLVKAGSGVMTSGIPDSSGVPSGCTSDTLLAIYNDLDSVQKLFKKYPKDISCIIVEPVAANMGVIVPDDGFLKGLRQICDNYGAVLIFDEVITGFRLKIDGAAGYFNVNPDLVTYGKIIGGGMPVGAYGGKREIMELVSPIGSVYQAGTLSGNPVAMSSGLAQMNYLKEHPEVYDYLESLSLRLRNGLNNIIYKYNIPCIVNGIGSLSCLYFTSDSVNNYTSAKKSDISKFREYFHFMLDKGNYFGASQFEAVFVSYAHTKNEIDKTLSDAEEYFSSVYVK